MRACVGFDPPERGAEGVPGPRESITSAAVEAAGLRHVPAALLCLLAITFHFLVEIAIGANSVRIGSTDLVLPLALLAAAWHWYRGGLTPPRWRMGAVLLWLAGLSAWLLVALVVGRLHTGAWHPWAVLNKMVGWFALLAYFAVGAWYGTFEGTRWRALFLQIFLLTGWIICAFEIAMHLSYVHGVIDDGSFWRSRGFFVNPNAFGFALAVMLALQAPFATRGELFEPWVHRLGMSLSLLALYYSNSRSAMLALVIAWAALLLMRRFSAREASIVVVLALTIGSAGEYLPPRIEAWVVSGFFPPIEGEPVSPPIVTANPPMRSILQKEPIEHRLELTRNAFEAWRQQPILGIGLGSFFWEQSRLELEYGPAQIHNTLLWLLTETGLIGAVLFIAFFVGCIRALGWAPSDPFLAGTLGMLLAFAGASVGMEAMYQRYLWFLLGLALVMPGVPSPCDARVGDEA